MLDLPLHPIVVHFPIGIGCLMPLVMLLNILAIRRWQWPIRTWWMIVFLQSVLLLSSILAVKAGEWDEESGKSPLVSGLESHEEQGETIPFAAAVILAITLIPIFYKKRSTTMMIASLIASLVLVGLLFQAGHSGGMLIYGQDSTNVQNLITP